MSRKTLHERFIEKVKVAGDDECWLWQACVHHNGYGVIWKDTKTRAAHAHKVSYQLFRGEVPEGMLVCHKCDTPLCVNPNHLFLGTEGDNSRDSVRKGRSRTGEKNPNVVLTLEQVEEARRRHNLGESSNGLSRVFGISKTQMRRVVSHESWK